MHTQTQQPLARRRGPGPGFHGPAPAWTECASLCVRMGGPDGPGQLVGSYISIIIHLRGSGEALDEGVALEAGPEREAAQDAVSRGQPQLLMYGPEKTPATRSQPWSARHPQGSRSSSLLEAPSEHLPRPAPTTRDETRGSKGSRSRPMPAHRTDQTRLFLSLPQGNRHVHSQHCPQPDPAVRPQRRAAGQGAPPDRRAGPGATG